MEMTCEDFTQIAQASNPSKEVKHYSSQHGSRHLLVNVMHDMHDKLNPTLCIQYNGVHGIMPLLVFGVFSGNVTHPRDESVITIANKEFQVLQEAKLRLGVHTGVEDVNVLFLLQRIPLLYLLFCEKRALPDLIRSSDIEYSCSISVILTEFVIQEIKIT